LEWRENISGGGYLTLTHEYPIAEPSGAESGLRARWENSSASAGSGRVQADNRWRRSRAARRLQA
jgi:hypothetical protein